MQSSSHFHILPVAMAALLLSSSPSWAGPTVQAKVGLSAEADRARADGDAEAVRRGIPNVTGAVQAHVPLSDWSTVRLGVRGGYVQSLLPVRDADTDTLSMLGANIFVSGTAGGQVYAVSPDKSARPFFLAELGGGGLHQHPLAAVEQNSDATCIVSPKCNPYGAAITPEQEQTLDAAKESTLLTGQLHLVVGGGVGLPKSNIALELAYHRMGSFGGNFTINDTSEFAPTGTPNAPKHAVSMIELSVGYSFGGG